MRPSVVWLSLFCWRSPATQAAAFAPRLAAPSLGRRYLAFPGHAGGAGAGSGRSVPRMTILPGIAERDVTITTEGSPLRLRIAEAGLGGRPLMLVHGFTGGRVDFTDWLGPLADRGWHAVAPDLRGHGESDAPTDERSYSLDIFAADVLALLDALDWPRTTLLGHSMGGMVAQIVALDRPERLDGLVLMDTGHGRVRGVDPALAELAAAVAREQGMAALMKAQSELDEAPLATPAHEHLLATRPGYAEFNDAKGLAASAVMYAAMATSLVAESANPDRLDRLRGIDLPTLVVVGEQDKAFLASSQRMADTIPGAHLEILAGGGHSPQFEAPDAWWRALTTFLDAL